jgi:hypothetical protein
MNLAIYIPSLLPQRGLKARLVAFSAFLSADSDASASSDFRFGKEAREGKVTRP